MGPDEQQTCGAEISADCCLDFECELAPGHAGDHEATFSWTNEPIGPVPARAPASTPNRFLPAAWADDLLRQQQLDAALNGSPFINPDAIRVTIPRDLL